MYAFFQYGWNALDYACYKNHQEIVILLTESPNWVKNGKTLFYNESCLHIACRYKRFGIAITLLNKGGDALVNEKTFVSHKIDCNLNVYIMLCMHHFARVNVIFH